jgi:hypothetical protein
VRQRILRRAVCLLMMCRMMFGMEVERHSPDSGNVLAAVFIPRNRSFAHVRSMMQRRDSLPDLRRGIALNAIRAIGDTTSPQCSPVQLSPVSTPPVGTPHSDISTPPGAMLNDFIDSISVITIQKEAALENGWIERKKRAFKTSIFSRANTDLKPLEFGTIVYHVSEARKTYRIITFEAQLKAFSESVAVDARDDAAQELRRHLIQEVENEARDKGCGVENMISDLTL